MIVQDHTIESVFGEDGDLAHGIPGYEMRPGQVELARAIESSILDERYLVAEGPTGIGKSFAYLIPAILNLPPTEGVGDPRSTIIVATANIALQEQLVRKDLPALSRLLPVEFSYDLLKGRNNYLCKLKYQEAKEKGLLGKSLVKWAEVTLSGDRSDLVYESKRWHLVSSSSDECLGKKCPHSKECFANMARRLALTSNVIVCNYHVLLLARALIPTPAVLICDEAHELEGVARSVLGWQLSNTTMNRIASWLRPYERETDSRLSGRIRSASDIFFDDVSEALGKRDSRRLESPDWGGNPADLVHLLKSALSVAARVANSSGEVEVAKAEAMAVLMTNAAERLELASEQRRDDWVYWLSRTRLSKDEYLHIHGAPIMVDTLLPDLLYRSPTVVFISATMTSGSSFEYIRSRLGVPDSAGELIAPSPFDLKHQGILVVPSDMPMPDTSNQVAAEEFYDGVADYAEELINLCKGRTLLLFTSWRSLNWVYDRLRRAALPYPVYRQGDEPKTKLLDRFKREEESVLLGVASFWQGVDVPGDALTGLLIDKIPFPVPTDPIQAAVGEYIQRNGGSSFFDHSIPHATIALSQGVGRLIRSRRDRGVVVITDKRLISKGYGKHIVRALPNFRKVRSFEAAESFMNG